jgi:anti-sigma B factor antagonist
MAYELRSGQDGEAEAPTLVEQGPLTIQLEARGTVAFVSLFGELDLSNAEVFESTLLSVEAGPAEGVIVDLSALQYIDSSGLAVLIRVAEQAWDHSRPFALLRGPEPVDRLFRLTGLAEHLPFAD